MKKFETAKIEAIRFENSFIATSGCTDVTQADGFDLEWHNQPALHEEIFDTTKNKVMYNHISHDA